MAALSALRLALYALLAIFSIALLGLTGARLQHTRTQRVGSLMHGPRPFYEPIVAELLSISILSFLWSIPVMTCIGARVEGGFISSYLLEILGLFILWLLYLVGAAIFSAKFHNVNFCWGANSQCRLMTSIHAFAWTNFILITILLLAAFAALLFGRGGPTAPLHGEGTAAAGGAAAGYGAGHRGRETRTAPGGVGQPGAPETRSVEGGPVSSGGAPVQQQSAV